MADEPERGNDEDPARHDARQELIAITLIVALVIVAVVVSVYFI
jgi:flagellar basal body-associated protein FliL